MQRGLRGGWHRWVLVALICTFSLWLQWSQPGSGLFASAERLVRDPVHRLVASDDPEQRVVVVDIDEASLSTVGAWPWRRGQVADLVEALATRYEARAIGLDIVFPAPADAPGDARLAALSEIAPLVLAQSLDYLPRVPILHSGALVTTQGVLPAFGEPQYATGYVGNHEGLSKARCAGNIGLLPDADGLVRHVPLVSRFAGRDMPLLPLAMLACPLQRGAPDAARLQLQGISISQWSLPFARQWSAYTVIPARAILDGSAPPDLVRGRWVLVGSSALGLNDRAATPLSAATAGVMVHAAAMTSLLDRLDGQAKGLPVDGRWVGTAWTVATLCLAAWALGRWRAWWLLPATVITATAWIGVTAWLVATGATFSASAPLIGWVLLLLGLSVELWMMQREQGRILRSFATYVAPSVLEKMLRQGVDNPMTPQHCDITVLSADMQDYTGLTKRSDLQEAAQLTREFLQCLTEPLLEFGGTLDKYTGDGLVAFWGAPLPTPDHAQRALDAARAIVANVRAWNEKRVRAGLAPARVRIGVESGHVLVGDLGTRFRRTYTAVGDCINTASKLQSVAKLLSCDLVVGPEAARLAGVAGLVPVTHMQLPGHNEVSQLWSFPSLGSSLPQATQANAGQPLPQAAPQDAGAA